MNLKLIFIFLMIGLCFGVANAVTYCYQESANSTNQTGIDDSCRLNYTGNYSTVHWDGTIWNPSNWYDGNWSTYTFITVNVSKDYSAYNLTWNYTKPNGTSSSILTYKRSDDFSTTTRNVTVPTNCTNQTKVQFYTTIDGYNMGIGGAGSYIYCYNGTNLELIESYWDNFPHHWDFYDEAMYWLFYKPQYSNVTQTQSTSYINNTINFTSYWTDTNNLTFYSFNTNVTGVWIESARVSMTGTGNWSNVSIVMPSNAIDYYWYIFANDSHNQSNTTPINLIHVYNVTVSNFTTASTNTYTTFWANFTNYNPSWVNFNFNYSTTNYSMFNVPASNNWYYEYNIPNVSFNTPYAYLYLWEDYNTTNMTTTFYNTTVLGGLNIIEAGTNGNLCLNFFEENNLSALNVDSLEVLIEYLYNNITSSNVTFTRTDVQRQCFNFTGNGTEMINARFQIFKTNVTPYTTREYYLYHTIITNASVINITMYTLPYSNTTGVIFSVYDYAQRTVPDAYINVQRLYPNLTIYDTIAMGLSDVVGQTRIYLRPNDIFYRFIITVDGVVRLTSSPMLITSNSLTMQLPQQGITNPFEYQNVANSVTFNNVTKRFHIFISDVTGKFSSYGYNLTKRTSLAETQICNDTSTTSSFTWICDASATWDDTATYQVNVYARGSPLQQLLQDVKSGLEWTGGAIGSTVYGASGLLLVGLFTFGAIAIGLFSPVISIALGLLALGVSAFLGLIMLSYTSLIAIAVSGCFLIWRMLK